MKLETREITDGLRFPEGPIAMADGSVLVVEIEGGRLIRVMPDGEKQMAAHLGGGPNGAAIGPDGHCYICNNGGFTWRTDDGFTRPTGEAADYKGGCIQRKPGDRRGGESLYALRRQCVTWAERHRLRCAGRLLVYRLRKEARGSP